MRVSKSRMKVKNALLKCVCYVAEYTIYNSVPLK